jgi:Bacterial SH3 domain
MMAIVRLCFGLGLSIALVAPASAELAMTGAAVVMRAGATGNAGVVQRVPQGAEIVLEKCARNWCRASWRGRFGYIPADAVVLGPPPATLPGDEMPPPAVYASPTYITPPAWRWTGPYVGLNGGVGSGSW